MSKHKILIGAAAIVSGLIIALIIILMPYFKTISTLKRVDSDHQFFTIDYKLDYALDEMMAQGGADDLQDLLNFASKQLFFGVPIEMNEPNLNCSSFSAVTPAGNHLMGRNYDLNDTPAMLVRTTPKNGYKSISMVDLSSITFTTENLPTDSLKGKITTLIAPFAPLDGVNEKGLAMCVLYLQGPPTYQNNDDNDVSVITTLAIRNILDYCATVDEAVAFLKTVDMHSSGGAVYHFLITDKSGKTVVVEYPNDVLTVVDASYVTNFWLTQGPESGTIGAANRYDILDKKLTETKSVLSEEESMQLLQDVSQNVVIDNTSLTQWSAVYNLDNLTVDLAIRRDYDKIFEIGLNDTSLNPNN